jgi:hypothetical protein
MKITEIKPEVISYKVAEIRKEVAAAETSIEGIKSQMEELDRRWKKEAAAMWKLRDKLNVLVQAEVLNRGIPPEIVALRNELAEKIKLAKKGPVFLGEEEQLKMEISLLEKALQLKCDHSLVMETIQPDSGNPLICEDNGSPGYRVCLVCNLGEWSYADEPGAYKILSNDSARRVVAPGDLFKNTRIIAGKKAGYEREYKITPWLPPEEIIDCLAAVLVGSEVTKQLADQKEKRWKCPACGWIGTNPDYNQLNLEICPYCEPEDFKDGPYYVFEVDEKGLLVNPPAKGQSIISMVCDRSREKQKSKKE